MSASIQQPLNPEDAMRRERARVIDNLTLIISASMWLLMPLMILRLMTHGFGPVMTIMLFGTVLLTATYAYRRTIPLQVRAWLLTGLFFAANVIGFHQLSFTALAELSGIVCVLIAYLVHGKKTGFLIGTLLFLNALGVHLAFSLAGYQADYNPNDLFRSTWGGLLFPLAYGVVLLPILYAVVGNFSERLTSSFVKTSVTHVKYARALAATQDGLWEWDTDRDRFTCAPQMLDLIGREALTTPNLAGYLDLVHAVDRPVVQAAMQRTTSDEQNFDVDHRLNCGDAGYRWFRLRGAIEPASTLATGSIRDIHDRRLAETAL